MHLSKTSMKNTLIFFLLLIVNISFAQVDWGSWKSVQLNYFANEKLTLKLRPIVRLNEDFGNYSDTSIDAVVAYKFSKNWSASILNRHFFFPNAPDVEFLFFNLKYQTSILNKLSVSNVFRYHLNFDLIGSRRDFIRNHIGFKYKTGKKITPIFTAELWFRPKDPFEFTGARYIVGTEYKMNSTWTLQTLYWRQAGYNSTPIASTHTLILNLIYNLKAATQSTN